MWINIWIDEDERGKQFKCVRNKVNKALVGEIAFVWKRHHFPKSIGDRLEAFFILFLETPRLDS